MNLFIASPRCSSGRPRKKPGRRDPMTTVAPVADIFCPIVGATRMKETSARLLRLLTLLQVRRAWSGSELADRLGVSTRTIRRDIDKLRDLDYPVTAVKGVAGGYSLGAGAHLPPLQLDDD